MNIAEGPHMDLPVSLSRRHAIRLLGGAALVASPIALQSTDASAARGWCVADPFLRIAGQYAHVYITSSSDMMRSANGKIRLKVTLPRGVEGKLRDILSDFGDGYDVDFYSSSSLLVANGKIPVQFSVYCPARDGTLPVTVEFAPNSTTVLTPASAAGTANSWITFRAGY